MKLSFPSPAPLDPKSIRRLPDSVVAAPKLDPREDLKSRSPEFGTLATKGHFIGTPLRDLLFGSSRGSG